MKQTDIDGARAWRVFALKHVIAASNFAESFLNEYRSVGVVFFVEMQIMISTIMYTIDKLRDEKRGKRHATQWRNIKLAISEHKKQYWRG